MATVELDSIGSKMDVGRPHRPLPEAPSAPSARPTTPSKQAEETEVKPQAAAALAVAQNPKAAVANEADKYLHTGAILGTATWAVWGIIGLALSPFPGLNLIPALVLTVMLRFPKAVYKFTSWLLVFIPVVGEAVLAYKEFNAEAGLDQVEIRINSFQKGLIIMYDIIVGMITIMYMISLLITFCYLGGSTTGKVAGKVADTYYNTTIYSDFQNFCAPLTN